MNSDNKLLGGIFALAALICMGVIAHYLTSFRCDAAEPLRGNYLHHAAALIGCGGVDVSYSSDGGRIITANRTHARIWNATTFQPMSPPLDHGGRISKAMLSSDGRRALTVGCYFDTTTTPGVYRGTGAKLWDVDSGRLLLSIDIHADGHAVWDAAINADGSEIASCAEGDNCARVWHVSTHEAVSIFKMPDAVTFVLFDPSTTRLVTVQGGAAPGARQWNLKTRRPIGDLMPCNGNRSDGVERPVCYSRNGKRLALADSDRFLVIDALSGKEIANSGENQLPIPGQTFCSVQLSSDGQTVATSATEYGSRAWKTSTARPLTDAIQDFERSLAAISPNGKLLLCSGPSEVAGVWDIGKKQRVRLLAEDRGFCGCCFSPDGKYIATTSIGEGGSTDIWLSDE